MILGIQTILLLSLFSPLTEAFPNLYMSWWAPTNGEIQKYINAWPRRVMVVFTVWIPIIIVLSKIIKNTYIIGIIATLIFLAFGLRLYFFDKTSSENYKKIPEFLYVIAFSIMGIMLYSSVPDNSWTVPVSILTIFSGASVISTFRQKKNKNLKLDVTGRLIFIAGFILFLYNLMRTVI